MIHIPYWWDKKLGSLSATIATFRPELNIINSEKPIPLTPPSTNNGNLKRRRNEIQSQLMLATNWTKEDDPTGWYIFLLFLLFFYFFIFIFYFLFFNNFILIVFCLY